MSEPIFKSIFGESWDFLSPVMKKHYANRPYTDDVTVVEGTLDALWGESGDDILIGGHGADWIKGSGGTDTYVYEDILDAGDTIVDFRDGEKVDLSELIEGITGTTSTSVEDLILEGYIELVEASSTQTDLYVDMDGSAGSGQSVLLASLSTTTDNPVLATDLIV